MKILLLGKNFRKSHNWGHQLFKEALVDGHEALFYFVGCQEYGKRRSVETLIAEYGPFDLVITDIAKYLYFVRGLGKIKIPKVHLVVDYVDARSRTAGSFLTMQDKIFDRDKYDIFFARHYTTIDLFKSRRKEPVYYLPFSVDTDVYKDCGQPRPIDVMVAWNTGSGYPHRARVAVEVARMKKSLVARMFREEYVKRLNQSKIVVNSINQWKTVNMKFTEILACGSLMFSDFGDEATLQGFVPGKHFVSYDYRDNGKLTKKLTRWLRNPEERLEIARHGKEFVREFHSNKVRAKQFWDILKEVL